MRWYRISYLRMRDLPDGQPFLLLVLNTRGIGVSEFRQITAINRGTSRMKVLLIKQIDHRPKAIEKRSGRRPLSRAFPSAAICLLGAFGAAQASGQGCDVYVPTHKSNSVAVVRTVGAPAPGGTVTNVIPVEIQPLSAAISPDKAFVYVTNSGWVFGSNSVSVIDTATRSVVATVPVGNFPIGVAFTPNGATAYVANDGSNDVWVINTATNTVTATIPVGNDPRGVAVTPMGSYVYVANRFSDTLSIIDTSTNTVVATVQGVSVFPETVVINDKVSSGGCG